MSFQIMSYSYPAPLRGVIISAILVYEVFLESINIDFILYNIV